MDAIAYSDIYRNNHIRYKRLPGTSVSRYTADMLLRLKELRLSKGLTQSQLAEKAGLSQTYYNEIEKGKKQLNQNRLTALARALDVSPSEILVDDDNVERAHLMTLFDQLDPDQQALVRAMAESFLAARRK